MQIVGLRQRYIGRLQPRNFVTNGQTGREMDFKLKGTKAYRLELDKLFTESHDKQTTKQVLIRKKLRSNRRNTPKGN
jgi:hypothetical protein